MVILSLIYKIIDIGIFHGVAGVPPLGLWNFHQLVKELKSPGKIFIECPYDFASEIHSECLKI